MEKRLFFISFMLLIQFYIILFLKIMLTLHPVVCIITCICSRTEGKEREQEDKEEERRKNMVTLRGPMR